MFGQETNINTGKKNTVYIYIYIKLYKHKIEIYFSLTGSMIHAPWVVCQDVGLTFFYGSRRWMEIEQGIFYHAVNFIFGIDNITRSTL